MGGHPRNPVAGSWPMAKKSPPAGTSATSPVSLERIESDWSVEPSPWAATTSAPSRNSTLGLSRARACMMREARSSDLVRRGV